MFNEQILDRLQTIFLDELNVAVPTRDTDLIAEGYLDSMMFLNLLMSLEQEFGVTIQYEELEFDNFQTINKTAAYIERQTANGKSYGLAD